MNKIIFVFGITIGLSIMGLAVFAIQIGLDNDPGWGIGRLWILRAGIAVIVFSAIGLIFNDELTKLGAHITEILNKFNGINYNAQLTIFSILTTVLAIGAFLWFALPNSHEANFNYYSSLAIAFKNQQLYLLEEPSPALLALDDPYDYGLRKRSGVEDFPWDVSLYKGKFYIYWGPVPSLLLTPFTVDQLNFIGDEHLVLLFICGLYLYYVFFSYLIWIRFNQALPTWLFMVSLLAIGLSAPAAWMLNYSRIYEGAIAGCQFFFIGGCYWAYSSLNDKSPNSLKLTLAGLHWALAIGTRITVLPVVLFAAGITLLFIFKQAKPISAKSFFSILLCLCAPLIIAALGLGWYNWERFNSIYEFGIKYQLANVNYNTFHDSFSIKYINSNLYNYLIHPLKFQTKFPYFQAIEDLFSNERLAGLIYTSPYFLFAGLFMGRWFRRDELSSSPLKDSPQTWLVLTLAGSSLISALTILLFYFPATRYGEDFMPSLLLLATASLGQGYRFLRKNKVAGRAYIIFTVFVAMFSAIMSSLVAFPSHRLRDVNVLIHEFYQLLGYK